MLINCCPERTDSRERLNLLHIIWCLFRHLNKGNSGHWTPKHLRGHQYWGHQCGPQYWHPHIHQYFNESPSMQSPLKCSLCFLSPSAAAHSSYIGEVLGNSCFGPFWWLSHKFLSTEAFHSFQFPLRILHKKISLLRGALYFRTIISQIRNPQTLNLEVSQNPIKSVWCLN